VLSGAAMAVASTKKELQDFLKNAGEASHTCITIFQLLTTCIEQCAYSMHAAVQ
jgi:hypothetical protein